MALVLRREKSGPLTSEELDGNFEWLEEKIRSLEEIPAQGEGIAQVVQEGSFIRLIGSYGKDYGSFSLRQNFRICQGKIPEKGEAGEMIIFEKEGVFTLLFYAGASWRNSTTGEVYHDKNN